MAENNDSTINGVNNGDDSSDIFDDASFPPLKTPPTPSAGDIDLLNAKIADLEKENSASESRIGELKSELEKVRATKEAELEKLTTELEAEWERAESSKKAAEMISNRADQLEAEAARLNEELNSALSNSAESNREVQKLRSELTELKREKSAVEEKVKILEAKMDELVKKSEESDNLISGFMQKIEDREIEPVVTAKQEENDDVSCSKKVVKVIKEKKAVIGAVSGGVIIAGAVMCYVRHTRN